MNMDSTLHPTATFLILCVGAYVFGSIPFGVLIARSRGIDIMKFGSGNIGATNVMRATGAPLGILVFVLDVVKGLLPSAIARSLLPHNLGSLDAQVLWVLVGLMAVLGHCVSPFLKFKGGKGVSTALGMIIAAAPLIAASAFSIFVVILATTRLMALASSVSVSSAVLLGLFIPGQSPQILPIYFAIGAFVTYRHRSNFARMKAGTEPKFSFKRSASAPVAAESTASSKAYSAKVKQD